MLFSLITENSALTISSGDFVLLASLSIESLIFNSSCLPIKVDTKLPLLSKRLTWAKP